MSGRDIKSLLMGLGALISGAFTLGTIGWIVEITFSVTYAEGSVPHLARITLGAVALVVIVYGGLLTLMLGESIIKRIEREQP